MDKKGLGKVINENASKFIELAKNKEILVVSHFDTDGITSASIMIKSLKKLQKKFSVKIVKSLDEKFIQELPKDRLIIFLDSASGCLNYINNAKLKDVFIIDHHLVSQEVPENVNIINPQLIDGQKISAAGLTYLFCKSFDETNKEFAKLAVLGMIGDMMEKEINKLNHNIVNDSEIVKKRGLLIYPSTRPLNRTLEYSSNPFIPGVTGNSDGVLELLREAGLSPENGNYKSLIELNDEEMTRLTTAILLRSPKAKHEGIIGDIFLLKFFNKLEDARELSATINACSRLGETGAALKFCLEISNAKKEAESIYVKYKQHIISGLKYVSETPEKFEGKGFVIINGKNKLKDTMAGTIASILSNSSLYEPGTIIITMAYYDDKIKVSARNVGRTGRNVREILSEIIEKIGGEVGGHEFAAGCIVSQEKENEFINSIKKALELEVIKI
ncbi:MAG: DHH family phosphoesterase [Nanoarchaeota archaeon]|nr:DHH family phosphoesterase [Nanoarchaeota archaeon]